MRNSRKPKGAWSITKLTNGNLKMTLTVVVGAYGKHRKDNKAMVVQRVTSKL